MSTKIRLVCATRHTAHEFPSKTALGRSLPLYRWPFVELRLFPSNTSGLSAVYNAAVREAVEDPAVLMFIHDDVHLLDFYWPERVLEGLNRFDIIGVAGNQRRIPGQPSWIFINDKLARDTQENLSGVIAHGKTWPSPISYYGAPNREVKLIDGVMMAARSDVLLANGLLFDEQFDFHFYDLDFCRQAECYGLHMGVWPIQVMHESEGATGSPQWRTGCGKYFAKWQS